jgi:hypothetical protein
MTIKIAYNWIGPRGPVDNTELPTLLGLAGVSDSAVITSRRFCAEGLWPMLFRNDSEFVMTPSVALQDTDTFIYPVHLHWRIAFQNYFCAREGIFEFSHTPFHIINNLKHQNGFMLLDMSAEAFLQKAHLDALHSYFTHYEIPLYKIIYLTGCMNPLDVYEQYCQSNNIPNNKENRLSFISFPSSYSYLIRTTVEKEQHIPPVYDITLLPEKLFLCWNRRIHPHRVTNLLLLCKSHLLNRSYVSMCNTDPEFVTRSVQSTLNAPWLFNTFGIQGDIVNELLSQLPLVIDGKTDINDMCSDPRDEARQFYSNSLISIVTETNFDSHIVTLTEKSFKPAKEKHPFIIVGVHGSLAAMQRLGFRTFSEFWDESYDTIVEPWGRLNAISRLYETVGQWNASQILDFKRKVAGILEHNYNLVSKISESNPDRLVIQQLKNLTSTPR